MSDMTTSKLSDLPAVDLEARRRTLVTKAAGNANNLSDEELREMAEICSTLRRRNAGPPKEAKAKRGKKEKPTLNSLLSGLE